MTLRNSGSLSARLRLIVITDPALAAPRSIIDIVGAAIQGGAPAVQLRNKGQSARQLMEVGRALRDVTHEAGVLLFVNDRLDVALALEADGVHLGPDDLPVAAARAATPAGFLIGRSADEVGVASQAVLDGADYIGCGAVYATSTKQDAGDVIGIEGLSRIVQSVGVPVVGIGGIAADRASAVASTGAAGIAVVGAVMAAEDPRQATAQLMAAL